MIKTLITATSFALGGAGIALVGYLGVYPRAFTNPVAAFPAVAAYHAPEAASMALRTESNVIVLDEVLVTASGARAPKRKVLPARLQPCSEWNDVGAMVIDPAGATGVHHVRTLCAPVNDEH